MFEPTQQLIIITGFSGSGKSIALNALEDIGFYCVDNLPAPLMAPFTREILANPSRECSHAAVGIDVRSGDTDLHEVVDTINQLKYDGLECQMIFLEAQDDVLMQRYSETRRRHPLSDRDTGLIEALSREKLLLQPLNAIADIHIDTSRTNLYELRDLIRQQIAGKDSDHISLAIESFGFKHGIPRNADFLFDTRCLPNPHWEEQLRPLTGLDEPVGQFLSSHPETAQMVQHLANFLGNWLSCFDKNDRSYITVAIGCTGGQHRSVFIAEQVAAAFDNEKFDVQVKHRELST
ncbi:MAG: RNase adapter RapZ [bacterium]